MQLAFALSSWFPVGLWAGVIFYLSSIPHLQSGLGLWDFVLRKIAHVVEYAVLSLLLSRAFKRTWPSLDWKKILIWTSVLAVLYAASDEWHQSFVPGRGPSVGDVLIDSCGVLVAILIRNRLNQREA
jgi:VanZ family protein